MSCRLRPRAAAALSCPPISSDPEVRERYADYLGDESRLSASSVSSLATPRSVEELAGAMAWHHQRGHAVTLSGGRTGVTGGACPEEGGHLVSTARLSGVVSLSPDDPSGPHVRVRAGTLLSELGAFLRERCPHLFLPVDPTETSASLGGMVSTDASGPRSLRYGSTRRWVRALRAVLVDGRVLELRRGEVAVRGGRLELEEAGGGVRRLETGPLPKPATKHSLGPYYGDRVDAVDVLVGSEGTLAVVGEVELALAPRPRERLYHLQFFAREDQAFDFVDWLRRSELPALAIEFFDERSLRFGAAARTRYAAMAERGLRAALYCEIELAAEDELEQVLGKIEEALTAVGASPEHSGAGLDPGDLAEMKAFRHAVPEQVNALVARRRREHPALHKIATDMAVSDEHMRDIYAHYRRVLDREGLEYAIFGHIGQNHFHVNVLPRDERELGRARELYLGFAREVAARGGAVSAEHGIGRIKKDFLGVQYGAGEIESLARIKRFFDPEGRLNPGVLLHGG